MGSVVLRDVVKTWGAMQALNGISLQAEDGELVALLGPSGCGKSTTLRLIAGLEMPDAGTIHIGQRDVTYQPPAQRGVAMVFQSYALFPHLTVAENIEFGLKVRNVPAPERARRLADAAELLGLGAYLNRRPAQRSGGQRQRVALGRAIVAQASVCLMDEPLSNLDAQLRQQMRADIRALQQRLGMTMVYVTHDQTEAMTMADKVVLMRSGNIEQMGTPAELYESPANTFVAGFIGSPPMNLLPAHEGRQLGIRPEHIRLGSVQEGLAATLQSIEYLGAESLLNCRLEQEGNVIVRLPGRVSYAVGDQVGLVWQCEDAHYFDAASGKAIV